MNVSLAYTEDRKFYLRLNIKKYIFILTVALYLSELYKLFYMLEGKTSEIGLSSD